MAQYDDNNWFDEFFRLFWGVFLFGGILAFFFYVIFVNPSVVPADLFEGWVPAYP